MTWVLATALLVAAAPFVLWPLVVRRPEPGTDGEPPP
jgi:hypothetical protein